MKWWQLKKRDADLERELNSDLELEEEEQQERGLSPEASTPSRLTRFRQSHSDSRAHSRCLELEQTGESSSRSKDQRPHSIPVAWLFIDCRPRDGVVHRRCDFAVHGGAVGSAESASLPRSRAAGDDLRAFPRSQHAMRKSSTTTPLLPPITSTGAHKTHGFEDMAAWRWGQFNLTGEKGELPEMMSAGGGSWNLFPLLGVPAAIGRTFTESEDRSDGNCRHAYVESL